MIVKKADGTFDYDLPTNFAQLARTLVQRAGGQISQFDGISPLALLFPAGRSLQRADGDLKDPRRVMAFPYHHAPADEWGFSLRDRLFVGHSPRKRQLEVISYNELAGRYEFQIVTDYAEGSTPKVRYTDRPTCTRCHRAEAPIVPPRDWDDSNANSVAAAGISWANDKTQTAADGTVSPADGASLDDGLSPIATSVDRAWEVNRSVLRAAELQFVQTVWQKGCRIATPLPEAPTFTASDCRAELAVMALANRLEIPFSSLVMPANINYAYFVPPAKLRSIILSNFPDQTLKFPVYNIPPRNLYQPFQTPLLANAFAHLNDVVKADVAIGDHIPDPTIAPDAPDRVPVDDLAADSDRAVSGIRRVWSNYRDLFTSEQWAAVAGKLPPKTDPGAGLALIDLYLKMRSHEAYSDRPMRRGALLSAVMDTLGLRTPTSTVGCCSRGEAFPPILFTDDTVIQPGLMVERQVLRGRCSSCHKSEASNIGYLAHESELSDRELVIQILGRELKSAGPASKMRLEFCRRLSWTLPVESLPVTSRMPQSLPLRKDILARERPTPQIPNASFCLMRRREL